MFTWYGFAILFASLYCDVLIFSDNTVILSQIYHNLYHCVYMVLLVDRFYITVCISLCFISLCVYHCVLYRSLYHGVYITVFISLCFISLCISLCFISGIHGIALLAC